MCDRILLIIYRLALDNGAHKITWIEQHLGFDDRGIIHADDKKNEPEMYAFLFGEECRSKIEMLYMKLLSEMRGMPYKQCEEVLEALKFLQEVGAKALWKYRQDIGQKLEMFVREFDRLDMPSELARLYESAQEAY
jgi:hypothetical protein